MSDFDTERNIGETMALVLRERLFELETLAAAGHATKETMSRLAFVRTLLVRFDSREPALHSVLA